MSRNEKLFWLACLALGAAGAVYTKSTSPQSILVSIGGAIGLLAGIRRYMLFATEAHRSVSSQAAQKKISTRTMWLIMFKKVWLYLFLPALIITVILVFIATQISGQTIIKQ